MKELIPTGKLRVGVVFAPAPSAFFVVKEANGEPRGVTVDLAVELGRKLGVPVEFMVASNSGLVTDATESGAIDVAFMPVDEERKKRVDFGPAYFIIESTYLVTGASGIKTVAEVDRPDVRVVGIANTTTIRAAGRSLKNTSIRPRPRSTRQWLCCALARPMPSHSRAIHCGRLWPNCQIRESLMAVSSRPASRSPSQRTGRMHSPMSPLSWRAQRPPGAYGARWTGQDFGTIRWRRDVAYRC